MMADILGSRSGITQTGRQPAADSNNFTLRIIIIDRSGSMSFDDYRPFRLQAAKDAAIEYIKVLFKRQACTDIAVISFGGSSKLVLPPTEITRLQKIIKRIRSIAIDGCTNITAGLQKATKLLAGYAPDDAKQVILLTDGFGDCDLRISDMIKQHHNTTIDVIGIGGGPEDVDEQLLKQIATTDSDGTSHYRFIKDPQRLKKHYRQLAGGIVWKGDSDDKR